MSNEELKKFFFSGLGNFIHLFSIVEDTVRSLLEQTAGVDKQVSLAIFSGLRTDKAMTNIRRIYQAKGQKFPKELDKAFQQLSIIAQFRNDVLHQRADFSQSPPVTGNRKSVLNKSAIRETPITAYTLVAAAEDLGRILLILGAFLRPDRETDDVEFALSEPWQYKPGEQASTGQKQKPPLHPKRKPPPQS
ncbi:hypothetical protein [Altererythrobacter sp. GH1-8]|uniref:hypothetical protein n=1 Tax=Altererythrobacter sp. GH1-8 TaxID=3349333 RepID=UPI00374CF617